MAEQRPKLEFGIPFQHRIIACALVNGSFLQEVLARVRPEQFTSELLAHAWETIQTNFEEKSIRLSIDTLVEDLRKLRDDNYEKLFDSQQLEHFYESLIGLIKDGDVSDREKVLDQIKDWAKYTAFTEVIKNSIDKLRDQDYSGIFEEIKDTFEKNYNDVELGTDYFHDIANRFLHHQDKKDRENVIPTGITELDAISKGGLGKKELGLILAPTGRGKSAMMLNMAHRALLAGKNVFYASCEMTEKEVTNRLDRIMCAGFSRDIDKLMDLEVVGLIRGLQEKYKNRCTIKDFEPGELTVPELRAYLKMLKTRGDVFDIVFVDYVGEMKLPKADREDISFKRLVTQLRGLAYHFDVPLWTAHQTNKGSHDEIILRHDSIADSFAILRVPDLAITMSAQAHEFAAGFQRITTVKNRFGPNEHTFVVSFHGETQTFTDGDEAVMKKESGKMLNKMLNSIADYLTDKDDS